MLTAPIPTATAERSYRVEYDRNWKPRYGMHWLCRMYGAGHWCRADGQPHAFTTREAAEAAGERWLTTGRG